mgnify:CR=1 FL=1
MALITGAEGNCIITGYNAKFNTWSASVSRAVVDLTGFADTGKRRQLGLLDITGSAAGHLTTDADGASDTPGLALMSAGAAATLDGVDIELISSTTSSACKIEFSGIVTSMAPSVDVNGDQIMNYNFELTGGALSGVTMSWDES